MNNQVSASDIVEFAKSYPREWPVTIISYCDILSPGATDAKISSLSLRDIEFNDLLYYMNRRKNDPHKKRYEWDKKLKTTVHFVFHNCYFQFVLTEILHAL